MTGLEPRACCGIVLELADGRPERLVVNTPALDHRPVLTGSLVQLRSADDVWSYIYRHGLPVNPVYEKLRRLGAPESALRVSAIIDANGLELGRVTWLRRGWPGLFDELAQVLPRLREYV